MENRQMMWTITRKTAETDIELSLFVMPKNARGKFEGTSGVGFFDHMLNSFCVHGGFAVNLKCKGDLNVDCHHTIEDVGIVLGMAFAKASGDKKGMARFCDLHIPMDEALAFCAVDYSGRPYLRFDADFKADMIGDYDTQMTAEFFRAFCMSAGVTMHLTCVCGDNDHHKTEALYKAAGRAMGRAMEKVSDEVLSAKGVL